MNGRNTEIHVLGDKVYETRVSISELAEQLTEGFIRIHRGCLVAVRVIHDITDRVYLNNGGGAGIYRAQEKGDHTAVSPAAEGYDPLLQ